MITYKRYLICSLLFLFLLVPIRASAQVQTGWSPLFQMSTGRGRAIEASLVPDRFGFVHAFWAESPGTGRTLVQYARYDGNIWTTSNDIFNIAGDEEVGSVVATLDYTNQVHLLWTQGTQKVVYYANASITEARSAKSWSLPKKLNASHADDLGIQVDKSGTVHMLYADEGEQAGVFYLRSTDGGTIWSKKTWVDPDILANHVPISLHLEQDSEGGLHAIWLYKDIISSEGDWVRYMHSTDQGETWSIPFTIAKNSEGADRLNAFSGPIMAVEGTTVHIIWAGGRFTVSTSSGIERCRHYLERSHSYIWYFEWTRG